MKRYLAFIGDINYPNGGWEDFAGDFDKLQTAKKFLHNREVKERWSYKGEPPSSNMWYHIIDSTTGEKVHSFGE